MWAETRVTRGRENRKRNRANCGALDERTHITPDSAASTARRFCPHAYFDVRTRFRLYPRVDFRSWVNKGISRSRSRPRARARSPLVAARYFEDIFRSPPFTDAVIISTGEGDRGHIEMPGLPCRAIARKCTIPSAYTEYVKRIWRCIWR